MLKSNDPKHLRKLLEDLTDREIQRLFLYLALCVLVDDERCYNHVEEIATGGELWAKELSELRTTLLNRRGER